MLVQHEKHIRWKENKELDKELNKEVRDCKKAKCGFGVLMHKMELLSPPQKRFLLRIPCDNVWVEFGTDEKCNKC